MHIRIGTRKSKLALWQADYVARLLQGGGLSTELVLIDTLGDKIQDVTISKIGSKGVFTEEIEEQLLNGSIDIAVHSAKDMQSELPKPFSLIAFTQREQENDVLLSHNSQLSLEDSRRPLKLGTSSTRRIATLRRHYPHVETVAVRGNLQTRIRKMEEGACDALLLAYAGVHRMGYDQMIVKRLPLDEFIPAVGQGSVAIEVAHTLAADKAEAVRRLVNHEPTEKRLLAERAFLRKLQGGCSIPVYALAQLQEHEELSITGGLISLDGQQQIEFTEHGPAVEGEALGSRLADKVLAAGGRKLLEEIKASL